jgi:hypothetical protein
MTTYTYRRDSYTAALTAARMLIEQSLSAMPDERVGQVSR